MLVETNREHSHIYPMKSPSAPLTPLSGLTNPPRARTFVDPLGKMVRRCSWCEEIKPLSVEHFYASTDPNKAGYNYRCRPCEKKRYTERSREEGRKPRNRPAEFINDEGVQVAPCGTCGTVLPLTR